MDSIKMYLWIFLLHFMQCFAGATGEQDKCACYGDIAVQFSCPEPQLIRILAVKYGYSRPCTASMNCTHSPTTCPEKAVDHMNLTEKCNCKPNCSIGTVGQESLFNCNGSGHKGSTYLKITYACEKGDFDSATPKSNDESAVDNNQNSRSCINILKSNGEAMDDNNQNNQSSNLSPTGLAVGLSLLVIVLATILIAAVFYWKKRRKDNKDQVFNHAEDNQYQEISSKDMVKHAFANNTFTTATHVTEGNQQAKNVAQLLTSKTGSEQKKTLVHRKDTAKGIDKDTSDPGTQNAQSINDGEEYYIISDIDATEGQKLDFKQSKNTNEYVSELSVSSTAVSNSQQPLFPDLLQSDFLTKNTQYESGESLETSPSNVFVENTEYQSGESLDTDTDKERRNENSDNDVTPSVLGTAASHSFPLGKSFLENKPQTDENPYILPDEKTANEKQTVSSQDSEYLGDMVENNYYVSSEVCSGMKQSVGGPLSDTTYSAETSGVNIPQQPTENLMDELQENPYYEATGNDAKLSGSSA